MRDYGKVGMLMKLRFQILDIKIHLSIYEYACTKDLIFVDGYDTSM